MRVHVQVCVCDESTCACVSMCMCVSRACVVLCVHLLCVYVRMCMHGQIAGLAHGIHSNETLCVWKHCPLTDILL